MRKGAKMKDFKSYTPEENGKNPQMSAADVDSAINFAKAVSAAMNGKSESRLLGTILAEAERGKREGRLTNADLDNFYDSVAPVLDGTKRKKLKELIVKLKNI